jgi:hypothetical protein
VPRSCFALEIAEALGQVRAHVPRVHRVKAARFRLSIRDNPRTDTALAVLRFQPLAPEPRLNYRAIFSIIKIHEVRNQTLLPPGSYRYLRQNWDNRATSSRSRRPDAYRFLAKVTAAFATLDRFKFGQH